MFGGLFIVSLIGSCMQIVKESFEQVVPSENLGNKELIIKDVTNGMSKSQYNKNLISGKYKQLNEYVEPHKDSNGKIIIENYKLHDEDLKKYGAYQTMKWVRQGKYNLYKK